MSMFRKLKYLRELQENQWKKKEDLQDIQNRKLRHIIDYSYRNVRFYRDLFNSVNVKPSDIKTVDDLSKLPIIDKKMIAEAGADAHSLQIDNSKCINIHTGGTTGYPLNIPRNPEGIDFAWAIDYRTIFAIGYKLWQKQLTTLSNLSDLGEKSSFIQRLGLLRRKNISVFLSPKEKIKIINSYKPEHLWHWRTTELYELATYVLEHPDTLIFRLNCLSVATEIITDDYRKQIKNAFDKNPLDLYGSAEVSTTAWECEEHNGYHINTDCTVVEFLKNGEPVSSGKKGEIVVTSLFTKTMPFIRYNLKDIGTPIDDVCSCGRTLPLM